MDGDHGRLARIRRGWLPWEGDGERSRPNKKLFYQVVLGVVRMREASEELLRRYADSSPEFRPLSGYTPIAVVTLDKRGVPVPENSVLISSFAWAWRPALEGKLDKLGEWSVVEPSLSEALEKQLVRKSAADEPQPLDLETIQHAYQFLRAQLDLDPAIVEEPQYVIRTYQWFTVCVFRLMPATDSAASRPPDSAPCRPGIPRHAGPPLRVIRHPRVRPG